MKMIQKWNDGWLFAKKDWCAIDPSAKIDDALPVSLPHTWYEDGDYYQGDAVYQKVFRINIEERQKVYVRFEGADKICQVFLNGRLIGEHKGGYTAFAVDMTGVVMSGKDNLITVLINNEKGTTVCPLSGDFTIFGGLYRDVSMIITDEVHFDYLYYGTEGILCSTLMTDEGTGIIKAESKICASENAEPVLKYCVTDMQGVPINTVSGAVNGTTVIRIENPHCWDGRKDAYLYQLKAQLICSNQIVDEVEMNIGFRHIQMDADRGFFLNHKHLKLNGIAKHQDRADVFCATSKADLEEDMQLIRNIGANAVRFSHYPHPQYVYDLCDRLGMIVWAEIPLLKMNDDDELFENAKTQLTEMICQNMHHPSICFWGIQNEVAIFGEFPFMTERLLKLNSYAKSLDDTRLTTSANLNSVGVDSSLNRITDVTAYNLYFGWYYGEFEDFGAFCDDFHRTNPRMPLGISEYGADSNILFHSAQPKVKDYSEEFQCKFHETVYPQLAKRDYIWGTFIWNMFDFVSGIRREGGTLYRNNKGLVTHDRKICKDAYYYYKAMWSEAPFVYIAEKRFKKRSGDVIRIKVYTNLPEVSLEMDGKKYRCTAENGSCIFNDIEWKPGSHTVKAAAGACEDEAVFIWVKEPEAAYVFVDPNPGINVRNWFVDEVEREKIFPANAYSILDTINTLKENPAVIALIKKLQPKVARTMLEGPGTFTLEQEFMHDKTLCTEEQIKDLNRQLTLIQK